MTEAKALRIDRREMNGIPRLSPSGSRDMAHPGDPIYQGDRLVGTVSSAGYGHRVGRNLAMGFVEPDLAAPGTALELAILGTRYVGAVVSAPLYDPSHARSSGGEPSARPAAAVAFSSRRA